MVLRVESRGDSVQVGKGEGGENGSQPASPDSSFGQSAQVTARHALEIAWMETIQRDQEDRLICGCPLSSGRWSVSDAAQQEPREAKRPGRVPPVIRVADKRDSQR